ncbi:MAG: Bug family tripartite tricarboxylate transporter substrate binding protein [Burkholderiales bacterium]
MYKHCRHGERKFLAGLIGSLILVTSVSGNSQSYPSKPIRWIIPSAPGGAYDLTARALTPFMTEDLGQPFVVDNRAGAGGIVGLEATARAAPDGHTVVAGGISQMVLNPLFVAKTPYDTIKDFTPVGLMGDLVMGLYVHASLDIQTLKGLIDYSKTHPGKVFYGSSGVGQSFHLAGEMLKLRTGADLNNVPYKGSAQALQDFFSARLQMMFYPPTPPVLAAIKSGTIRPLAAMSDQRLRVLPDTPTFEELGVQSLGVSGWGGVAGPAGMPREIVMRFNQAMNKASSRPEAARHYDAITMVPIRGTPEDMGERIRGGKEFWGVMIKKLGIKPEA